MQSQFKFVLVTPGWLRATLINFHVQIYVNNDWMSSPDHTRTKVMQRLSGVFTVKSPNANGTPQSPKCLAQIKQIIKRVRQFLLTMRWAHTPAEGARTLYNRESTIHRICSGQLQTWYFQFGRRRSETGSTQAVGPQLPNNFTVTPVPLWCTVYCPAVRWTDIQGLKVPCTELNELY